MKILIVDDEVPVRKMIHKIIEPNGYDVLEAENGIEAEKIVNASNIDLLITDIVMPGMHGLDLIMSVKKSNPELPVIAISGGGGIAGRFDYLEIASMVGAENIIRKPFSKDELLTLVEKFG